MERSRSCLRASEGNGVTAYRTAKSVIVIRASFSHIAQTCTSDYEPARAFHRPTVIVVVRVRLMTFAFLAPWLRMRTARRNTVATSSTALNDDDVYELSPVETAAIPAEWRSAATYTLEMAVK